MPERSAGRARLTVGVNVNVATKGTIGAKALDGLDEVGALRLTGGRMQRLDAEGWN